MTISVYVGNRALHANANRRVNELAKLVAAKLH
jgi:hypothetical protein